jgi:hypothetical protein
MTTQAPPGMSFRLKTILGVAVIEAVLLSILVFSGIRFLSATAESEFVQRTRATVKAFSVATNAELPWRGVRTGQGCQRHGGGCRG